MMKKISEEENLSLEKIKTELWSILEVFNKENISSYDYYVLLFFLSAYKDGLLSADLIEGKNNLNVRLNKKLQKSKTELSNQYLSIFHIFESSIQNLSEIGLKDVLKKIVAINRQFLKDNFTFFFNSVLFRISHSRRTDYSEYGQSIELTRFMCNLADLEKNAKVFNPFAGRASFNVFLNQGQNYLGQEENEQNWAFGKLRLIAFGRFENSRYDNNDSIYNWPDSSNKFDLIVSIPPTNLNLSSKNIRGKLIQTYRRVEQLLIDRSIENLSPTGKVITIVPHGFLRRSKGEEHIFANLINNDLVESIISLPSGLILSNIPITILVLNKAKKMPGKVKFVDAKKFVVSKGLREKVLDDYELDRFIRSEEEDDSVIRIVDNEQIRLNDYNLCPPRYYRKEIDGVRLGEILSYTSGEFVRANMNKFFEFDRLIKVSDLKNDKVDFTIDTSNSTRIGYDFLYKRRDICLITESCLLVSAYSIYLSPTLFELTEIPFFIKSNDIFSFKINETLVDKAYLVHELHEDYVLEQLAVFKFGSPISSISKVDFLSIVIKLPTLVEQRAKVEGALQAFILAKQDELKLELEILGIKEDTFNEFASIKHTFRQYLGALKSNVTGTRKFLSKKNGMPIKLDDIYSSKLNQTLSDHLFSIEDTISALSKLLETDSHNLNRSKVESLNLNDLVITAQKRLYQDSFEFESEWDKNSFGSFGYEIDPVMWLTPLIDINLEDFVNLFSNIVSNAINHGFKDENGNIIRSIIYYDHDAELCVLEVSNNGSPMAEKFTFKHLVTRGEKTTDSKGTGVGGADIRDIIAKYKGAFELIKDADSPFPVTYKISFPLSKTIIENEI